MTSSRSYCSSSSSTHLYSLLSDSRQVCRAASVEIDWPYARLLPVGPGEGLGLGLARLGLGLGDGDGEAGVVRLGST
jgi:hypothetical protein